MYWSYFINSLVFDNYSIINNHVSPKADVDFDSFILYRQSLLAFHLQARFFQFIGQAFLIYGFKKSRPQGLMNFNGAMYDISSDFFDVFH